MRPRTAGALARLSELGHRVAESDPHRPDAPDFVVDALEQLNTNISRLTREVSKFRGNSVNNVLFSGTGQIPATGDPSWSTQTEVPFARVIVIPIVNDLRVENAPPRDGGAVAAKAGRGFVWCPVAAGRIDIPLVGNILTVYGTAGAFFDIALLANPIA